MEILKQIMKTVSLMISLYFLMYVVLLFCIGSCSSKKIHKEQIYTDTCYAKFSGKDKLYLDSAKRAVSKMKFLYENR